MNEIKNIKLTIEYDGTNYHGWQTQVNAVTLQDVVANSISNLVNEKCILEGASRTDVGVHALGQVASFKTNSNIPPDKFSYALNAVLPEDIVIKKSEEVSLDFFPRANTEWKKYRYLIYNSKFKSAIHRKRAFHVARRLDFESMQKAMKYFLGTHDFFAFMAAGSSVKTTVRTIFDVSLLKNGDIIEFEVVGNGFLYNMVRIIVGTLVEVGLGNLSPEDIPNIIESRDRKNAGRTAPAEGLYLVEIRYRF